MKQVPIKGKRKRIQKNTDEKSIEEQDYAEDMARPVSFKDDAPEIVDDTNPVQDSKNNKRKSDDDYEDL